MVELIHGEIAHAELAHFAGSFQLIERLGEFYPTPGYCDELMIFFRLTELMEPDRFAEADDDEDIEARLFTLDEASQLVSNGEAPDMKTALGLTLL